MNKYQIVEVGEKSNHAGSKATADVALIADSLDYKRCVIRINLNGRTVFSKLRRQFHYWLDFNKAFKSIEPGSVVLLQHPFHHKQLNRDRMLCNLKAKKQVKFISIVHDVEVLRGYRLNEYYKAEFSTMLEIADIIVVHNQKMLEWFTEEGIPTKKLVSLEIFDYLQDNEYQHPTFERSINVAGNLDVNKSNYIYQLKSLKGIDIHLYGPNFDTSMAEVSSVHYHGSFPSSEIPSKLNRGFGLVWDGENISSCSGGAGDYLRYNNPHKLSLYLSSGLPVVIWNDAAEASFVKNNNLGIGVDSLYDLEHVFNDLNKEKYEEMVNNVEEIRKKLILGYYTNRAITKAEAVLSSDNS